MAGQGAHADSFDATVAQHVPGLREAARRLTGCRDEAEDLVQDAVVRAWTFWNRFEPGSNPRAWLHRILMNTFINAYRKRRRGRELHRLAAEQSDREAVAWAEHVVVQREGVGDEVDRALKALPTDFRTVIELVDLADFSYREVASELGCPLGTVMSRLHRARKHLQEQLADYASAVGYRTAAGLPAAAA